MEEKSTISTVNAFTFLRIDYFSLICSGLILGLSSLVFYINHYYWHYAWISYFWSGMPFLFFILLLCVGGGVCFLGAKSKITQVFCYIGLYSCITLLVMYATTAVQLTPFSTIDEQLLWADLKLHYNTVMILEMLAHSPLITKALHFGYSFVLFELLFLPILLIIFQQFYNIKKYFFYILATTLIGYIIYYIWPTAAPASMLYSPHFIEAQHNTGIKFYQVHHYIYPESFEGGMISMPSFHMIWAILCQQSVWNIRWLRYTLLPFNILVICAALFLGWHYFVDFLGSLFVVFIAWLWARRADVRQNSRF